jgi:hypothetical protein
MRTIGKIVITLLLLTLMSSCLLTIGAPVVRRLQPNAVSVEAGAAFGNDDTSAVYGYAGVSMMDFAEIGLLPFYFKEGESDWGRLFIPFRIDPLPYQSPVHISAFTGPVLKSYDFSSWTLHSGFGFSIYPSDRIELIGSYSWIEDDFDDYTISGELSLLSENGSRFGIGAMYCDGYYGLTGSASHVYARKPEPVSQQGGQMQANQVVMSENDTPMYIGDELDGLPHGEGKMMYPDGSYYIGEFQDGNFHGSGMMYSADGETQFIGTFENGFPIGVGNFFSGETMEKVIFDNGMQAGEEHQEQIRNGSAEYLELKEKLEDAVANGLEESGLDILKTAVEKAYQELRRSTIVDRFIHGFDIGEGRLIVDVTGDRSLTLVFSDTEILTDNTGEVLALDKKNSGVSLSASGIGFSYENEEIARQYKELKILPFSKWGIGYMGSLYNGDMSHQGNLSLGYRRIKSKIPFPGPDGGRRNGSDFRFEAGGSVGYAYSLSYSANSTISLGYYSLNFGPLNQNTLKQAGKGWSIGGKAGAMGVFSDYGTMFIPVLAPYISFDRYVFNPSTAKYRMKSFELFVWPYPITVGFTLNSSF